MHYVHQMVKGYQRDNPGLIRKIASKIVKNELLYDLYVSCHRPFLPGTSLEPAVIPTAQASSFTLQYFPYYV